MKTSKLKMNRQKNITTSDRASTLYSVGRASAKDVEGILALYHANGFVPESIPTPEEINNRIFGFRDGEIIVRDNMTKEIVAYSSVIPIDSQYNLFAEDLTHERLWMLENEESANFLLRRVFLARKGGDDYPLATLIDNEAKALALKMKCKYLYTVSRLPGYQIMSDIISLSEYVKGLRTHMFRNHNVSLWQERGYEIMRAIDHYREGDLPSSGCAILLRWTPRFNALTRKLVAAKATKGRAQLPIAC